MSHRETLTAEEEEAWVQIHLIAQCLPSIMEQQLRRDGGLSQYDYAVLLTLYRSPRHTVSMVELSAITAGSLSRLSHTISRMERRELVTRERQGANRFISLTHEGRRVFLIAAAGHMDEIRGHVLDHLRHEDLAELARLLRPVADHLRSVTPRG